MLFLCISGYVFWVVNMIQEEISAFVFYADVFVCFMGEMRGLFMLMGDNSLIKMYTVNVGNKEK